MLERGRTDVCGLVAVVTALSGNHHSRFDTARTTVRKNEWAGDNERNTRMRA